LDNATSPTTLKDHFIKIREAKWFSNLTTSIIIFYAAILGLKTIDEIEGALGYTAMVLDYFVTIYFLIEIIIKMTAASNMKEFFSDKWNVFDFIIVVITLIPLEDTALAPIARLLRVFRVLRLLTARPELKEIIDMLIGAIPAIVDIALLMFIIFYIYAVTGNFLFAEAPSGLWTDFLVAMLTLFRILTFEDWTDVMYEAMEIYSWAWVYFVSFVIIAAFVFLNLFVAVIISEMEKLHQKEEQENPNSMDHKIDALLEKVESLQDEIKELKSVQKP
jgi:voltage-gated sodium channel